jgi:hypothetical protein
MAIDTSGKWWKGEDADDLVEYVRVLTEQSSPATKFVIAKCACGADRFRLYADRDEGCAKRQCASCGKETFICDSEEAAAEARFKQATCGCKKDVFDVAVGFSLRDDGEIKWITVGSRCGSCGMLGAYVDWKINYAPTAHLYSMV